jgi:Flp pilus assembly protein TadG
MTRPSAVPGFAGPDQRGSATLELVALTPALLALLLAVLAAARITAARQQVDAAAREAARAASLQSTLSAGRQAAHTAAAGTLAGTGVSCTRMRLTVAGDYAAPAGTRAAVRVQVSCTVRLADLALPGLPAAALSAPTTARFSTATSPGAGHDHPCRALPGSQM